MWVPTPRLANLVQLFRYATVLKPGWLPRRSMTSPNWPRKPKRREKPCTGCLVTENSGKSGGAVEKRLTTPMNKVENAVCHLLNCGFLLVIEPGSLTRPGGR